MNAASKFSRVVFVSPWFLLVFAVIPLIVILNVTLHIRLPLAGVKLLLVNNACFTLLAAARFLRYCAGLCRRIRYGECCGKPRRESALSLSQAAVQETLVKAGFAFNSGGSYGEKGDYGYLGTALLYGGLLLVLVFGTLDNLRQFSGTLLDGMGPATKLSRAEAYRSIIRGPLAAKIDTLPQMQIIDQIMPSREYPHGATAIALTSADGTVREKTVKPMEPFRFGDYDITMARFVVEPQIMIRTKDSKAVFNGIVPLSPDVRKEGAYRYHGQFKAAGMEGVVYYQSDSNLLKVLLNKGGTWVFNNSLKFQVDQQAAQGDYILSCARLGKWTEIHVVRRRHTAMLAIGGILALIGALVRLAIRPQRVWLAEMPGGCRVWTTGTVAKRLLGIEG